MKYNLLKIISPSFSFALFLPLIHQEVARFSRYCIPKGSQPVNAFHRLPDNSVHQDHTK